MLIEQVKKLSVEERWLYWIKERHEIYLKKEAGKPKPWTDDVIFQQYKFTNVRRMNDKVSQWLLKNWYQPNHSHPRMLVATTLARQLNNPESLEAIGFPSSWKEDRVERILTERAEKGLKNFSGAYMITGTLGGTKVEQIVRKVVTPISKVRMLEVINPDSIEESVKALLPFAGFSTFIAGQVVADLVFAIKGTWKDKHTWAAIGPGSRRGMNRLLGRDIDSPMRQPEFNGHLAAAILILKDKLPYIMKGLHAIDVQNTLCEHDKYERCLWGEGRPKQKYNGVS